MHLPLPGWWNLGCYAASVACHRLVGRALFRERILTIAGVRILVRGEGGLGIGFLEEIFMDGVYDRLPPGRVVFDAGANCGYFALRICSRDPEVRVWCFEPHPRTCAMLRRNIELNGWSARIEVIQAAVGGRPGTCSLRLSERSTMGVVAPGMENGHSEATIEVPMVTLDGFAAQTGVWPDLIKMDIEGCEVEGLEASSRCLEGVCGIVVETHSPALTEATVALLERAGFEVRTDLLVHGERPRGSPVDSGRDQ